jgi:hypothetical protein
MEEATYRMRENLANAVHFKGPDNQNMRQLKKYTSKNSMTQ